MDFDAIERAFEESGSKLFLLCNPHNPGGRVWTEEELRRLGDICLAHGAVVVSDEIHADFVWEGRKHVPFATLGEKYAACCVICTAASKSFNLAGFQTSNIVIPNAALREKFQAALAATGFGEGNVLGMAATQAAYETGGPWLDALKRYIFANYEYFRDYLGKNTPQLKVMDLEGTYLAWVDCRALGLDDEGLEHLVEDDAKLWLDMGSLFGEGGSGFVRFNLAVSRSVLEQALVQFASAVNARS